MVGTMNRLPNLLLLPNIELNSFAWILMRLEWKKKFGKPK